MQTIISGCPSAWPELSYDNWKDTLKTIHLWTQIVGKVRLQAMPWQNHSWHTTLYLSPRGFSSGSMPYKDGIFELEFDFKHHVLMIKSTFNENREISLPGKSVADFYNELFQKLEELNIHIDIYPRPNELPYNTPFAELTTDHGYDQKAVINFWQATVSIQNVFQKFRSGFTGKCSPVHLFWGAFDIAVTRFSGRPAPMHPGGMPNIPLEVMQEAYSQEVSSAGFWPGSDDFPEPIFYSYCYPTPDSFSQQPVSPKEAFWSNELGEFMLKYDDVRQAEDPEAMLMEFLQSTYVAAAKTGNWDRKNLEQNP